METRPLSELNYNDAKSVVLNRFDEGAVRILDQIMRNPQRKICPDAGDIVYDEGVPVCFQTVMLRRVYLKAREVFGVVNGLTCLKKGAPPEAYIDLRIASRKPRGGSMFGFGNSQNQESSFAAHRLAIKKNATLFEGPTSCTRLLWLAVRPIECAMYFFRRKIVKASLPRWKEFSTLSSVDYEVRRGDIEIRRLKEVKPEFFDVLMSRYIETNEGLVCSRTAEEIEWIFGERISSGQCVLLGAFKGGKPVGYIIARSRPDAKRWQILDWFAIENDPLMLEPLLSELCIFLKRKTPAMMLESIGFPMWVQPLLTRYLPHKLELGHNAFSWGSGDKEFRESALSIINSPKSWFFGPYDGDECMG